MLVLKEFSCSVQNMQSQIQSISHYKFRYLIWFQVSLQIWLVSHCHLVASLVKESLSKHFILACSPRTLLQPRIQILHSAKLLFSAFPFIAAPLHSARTNSHVHLYLSILPIIFCNGANCQLLQTNAAWDEEVNGREVSKETENHLLLTKHVFISFNELIKQLTDKAIKLN